MSNVERWTIRVLAGAWLWLLPGSAFTEEGESALQMYNWKTFDVPGGRIYTLTAEDLTKGKGVGRLTLEGITDVAFNIENTGGQWKTIKSTFEQKDAVHAPQ
jgi:hypothetical protein